MSHGARIRSGPAWQEEDDEGFDDIPETELDDEDYDEFVAREFDPRGRLKQGIPPVGLIIVLLVIGLVVLAMALLL